MGEPCTNADNERLKEELSQAYEKYALAAGEVMRLKNDFAAKSESTKTEEVWKRLGEVQNALRKTLADEAVPPEVKHAASKDDDFAPRVSDPVTLKTSDETSVPKKE